MALPALRQPKFVPKPQEVLRKHNYDEDDLVIITLKNDTKFVVTSDAYHGILADESMYRCVYCSTCMELDKKYKELHKRSQKHTALMNEIPYVEEFAESLVRKLNKDESYCTICNVTLPTHSVARHVSTEAHTHELARATNKAQAYQPNLFT